MAANTKPVTGVEEVAKALYETFGPLDGVHKLSKAETEMLQKAMAACGESVSAFDTFLKTGEVPYSAVTRGPAEEAWAQLSGQWPTAASVLRNYIKLKREVGAFGNHPLEWFVEQMRLSKIVCGEPTFYFPARVGEYGYLEWETPPMSLDIKPPSRGFVLGGPAKLEIGRFKILVKVHTSGIAMWTMAALDPKWPLGENGRPMVNTYVHPNIQGRGPLAIPGTTISYPVQCGVCWGAAADLLSRAGAANNIVGILTTVLAHLSTDGHASPYYSAWQWYGAKQVQCPKCTKNFNVRVEDHFKCTRCSRTFHKACELANLKATHEHRLGPKPTKTVSGCCRCTAATKTETVEIPPFDPETVFDKRKICAECEVLGLTGGVPAPNVACAVCRSNVCDTHATACDSCGMRVCVADGCSAPSTTNTSVRNCARCRRVYRI